MSQTGHRRSQDPHGTDIDSAEDIIQQGLSPTRAAELGGGDAFWTTTRKADADIFSPVNPSGGTPRVVCVDVSNSVLDSMRREGTLDVGGRVHIFAGEGWETLNEFVGFSKD